MLRTGPASLRAAGLTLTAGLLALSLAACGSNLSADEVARASGNGSGTGTGSGDGALGGTDTGGIDTGGTDSGGVDSGGTDSGGTDTGGTDSGGTDSGGTDSGGTDSGGTDSGGTTDPIDENVKAGSCEGFKNQTGITDDAITIGNSSDVTGPSPGLFATAQDAAKAFVNYFNAAQPDGICGRKLVLKTYDSKTDASADQQQYTAACSEVFAMVGSTSAFDLGGAKTAQDCGLPDLRAGALTFERNACTTCFGVQAVNTNFFENAVPRFVLKNYGDAGKHAAFFYSDAGAAKQNAEAQVVAMERQGMNFDVVQGVPTSEFSYSGYVQQMIDNDIEVVFFTTAYPFSAKMRQAMDEKGYEPKLYLRDPTDYNPKYIELANGTADGTVIYMNFVPFEERGSNAEINTYITSLKATNPNVNPEFFGVFSWSAGRLFTQLATELGGKLTRASLIEATRKVNNWTGNGMHAPQPVGSKGTGECWRFVQLDGDTWKPIDGNTFKCQGLTKTT